MAVAKGRAIKMLVKKFPKSQTKKMAVAKSRPFTVLVEGNIGCGKTTFLQHFAKVRIGIAAKTVDTADAEDQTRDT